MDDTAQELFLLEFLVDRVNIPSVQAIHDDILPVTTCIEFKILNLPPIYISQDAANEKCTCVGENPQVFGKGKSCLFALPRSLLQKPICSFPVVMSVYKKLPPSVLPDVMSIGSSQIETRDMLNCLLEEGGPEARDLPCRTLKNKFRIATATGQCVGEVGLFLRFSRLGGKVVTQFQNPRNRKPYLFKGAESSPVFQCRRIPSRVADDLPCDREPTGNQRTCCETSEKRPATPRRKRPEKPGARPCCSSKTHQDSSSSCPANTKFQNYSQCPDVQNEKTRQCGCEIKEGKPYSCNK